MSLPSIQQVAQEMGISLATATPDDQEKVLVGAMRRDLPLAVEFLHQQAHHADQNGGSADWLQDPNSPIGKQLIRLHASDALRPLASRHFCHDKVLTFINCCGGKVSGGKKVTLQEAIDLQIKMQDGTIARADC
ncbi:MAG: hypothetical protein ACHQVK_01075 [Candidatus Paceibacterales bacterium]